MEASTFGLCTVGVFGAVACAGLVASRATERHARAARDAWRELGAAITEPTRVAAGAAYREADVPGQVSDQPPPVVRAAAWACFFLGQALAAWGVLALVAVCGVATMCRATERFACLPLTLPLLAVMAPPMVMAWSRWTVGASLLRCDPTAGARARGLAWWAIALNLIVLAWAVVQVVSLWDAQSPFLAADEQLRVARMTPVVAVALLAAVYIGHAFLMLAAARALEALRARRRAANPL